MLHSQMESILHSVRQIAMACLHGLWSSDYETLQCGTVRPDEEQINAKTMLQRFEKLS